MSIKIVRINNEVVEPIKHKNDEDDKRETMGANIFPNLYCNVFAVGKKHSGKTLVINKIVKSCATSETTIIVFSNTVNKDKNILSIKDYCRKKGIAYIGYDSMKQDDVDVLEVLIKQFQAEAKKEQESDDEEIAEHEKPDTIVLFESEDEDEPPKKPKYKAPEYILIFDDISNELKNGTLVKLMKMNRHWKCRIIVSSQAKTDLLPQNISQCDYILVFKGQPLEKLERIYHDADIDIPFNIFDKLYKDATKEQYNFFYIDVKNELFRKNFNKLYQIDKELIYPLEGEKVIEDKNITKKGR